MSFIHSPGLRPGNGSQGPRGLRCGTPPPEGSSARNITRGGSGSGTTHTFVVIPRRPGRSLSLRCIDAPWREEAPVAPIPRSETPES
jgi:hypothetical protein